MNLRVGTSGYSYKEWKGFFYPKDIPAGDMLAYYSERFPSVEINNTAYKFPVETVLKEWAETVPADFMFVLKAHQRITHRKRLKNVDDTVSDTIKVTAALKKRLGALLFQLPPNFKKDAPRLRDFLKLLPAKVRAVFEFRHESWFDEEIFELLHDHNAALCIAEADDGVDVPFVATADWGYLRLRSATYDDKSLKRWVKQVHKQQWRDAFVFFKHEDEGVGPKLATRFLELLGR